jgi:hypothetical protein
MIAINWAAGEMVRPYLYQAHARARCNTDTLYCRYLRIKIQAPRARLCAEARRPERRDVLLPRSLAGL